MIYFTADPHFGHYKIIEYCNRPFKSERHMDQELIRLWNETVSEEDTIYVLGDMSMVASESTNYLRKIVGKLNGTKHLILCNHDQLKPFSYVEIGFTTVHTAMEFHVPDAEEGFPAIYNLIHDPAAIITDRTRPWLVGHVHDIFAETANAINVGVDVRDFKPMSLDEVKEIANKMYFLEPEK